MDDIKNGMIIKQAITETDRLLIHDGVYTRKRQNFIKYNIKMFIKYKKITSHDLASTARFQIHFSSTNIENKSKKTIILKIFLK